MVAIKDILSPREEVIKGEFQGVLQAHKADEKKERLESDPRLFFEATYPSNAIKNVLDRINDKLRKRDSQGAMVLSGPYGSGKSHGLIALYHLFKHQDMAKEWTKYWNIETSIPKNADGVILSAQKIDADFLWEPIFQKAGKKEFLEEVSRYPTTDTIEKLVGNRTLAIVLDEIESWYVSLEEDNPELLERNRFFIQNLLQVANDPDKNLFVFISSLGKGTSLDEIIHRTGPPFEDMSATGDRERIIMHRLFETERSSVDEDSVRGVVKSYVDKYDSPIQLEDSRRYLERMIESYPFHPQLLDLLDRIYETASERQNVRGEMRVLADMLANFYDKTDLLVLSDINEKAFRGINRELVNKFAQDVRKRISNIPQGDRLLRSALMFSLDKKSAFASESDVLLGTLKPSDGMTLTQLSMSLENLVGSAYYLHKEDGRFAIKTEENIMALIEREKRDVSNEEGLQELANLVKKRVFDNQVYIYEIEQEEIPDDKNISFVTMGKSYETKVELREELEDFYRGQTYQNTTIFITPKNSGPLEDSALVEKTKRIVAARNLFGKIEDAKKKLDESIQEEQKEISESVKEKYGHWVKWSPEVKDREIGIVLAPIGASIEDVREKIETDESLLEEKIGSMIHGEEEGLRIGSLLKDFKKFRKLPVITSDNSFYNVIRRLCGEKWIIQGDRSKFFIDSEPAEIKDDYVLFDPKFVPESRITPEPEPGVEVGPTGELPAPGVEEKAQIIYEDAEGNSPRVILSKFEAQLNEGSDTITRISLDYSGEELTKEELLEFIKNLPKGKTITARLEVKRRES